MKNFITLLCFILVSVYGNAATLDVSGWQQKDGSGNKKPVVITGVAADELFFATATPGVFTSRVIEITDLPTGIPLSKIVDAGTSKAGTQASPITANPYSPTWVTEKLLVYYGATGQINLPLVANYTNKSIDIYITGAFTVTIDPNGSEVIVKNGVSLGAGVSDSVYGASGLVVRYYCDGVSWNEVESQGVNGYSSGTFSGTGNYAPMFVYSGTMSADASVTFSPALTRGQWIDYNVLVTGESRTLTFTSSKRVGFTDVAITTLVLPVGHQYVSFYYDGTTVKVRDSVAEALPVCYGIACSDETTAITTGTGKATFRVPHAMTLTEVRASVTTAPTGSTILIDINESGTTVISTKLMIDASEKTSTTATTAYVISDTALADDSEITIDFDQVGSTVAGAGVKVWLIGVR